MATDWDQNFKKLYERTSASWRRLPAWVRGYGDEILRAADFATGLVCDTTSAADVSVLIYADRDEQTDIAEALDLLMQQGFLTAEDGGIYITNLMDGSEFKKSVEASRKRKYRESNKEPSDIRPPDQSVPSCPIVSHDVPSSPVVSQSVPFCPTDKIRSDQIRSEDMSSVARLECSDIKPEKVKQEYSEPVQRVFDAWREITGHPGAKLDKTRANRIKARLKEGFTPEQLIQAIRGSRNDKFLMGANDRNRVFDGIETLLRDAPQVEKLMALDKQGPAVIVWNGGV